MAIKTSYLVCRSSFQAAPSHGGDAVPANVFRLRRLQQHCNNYDSLYNLYVYE